MVRKALEDASPEHRMELAVEAVRTGRASQSGAAREFGVPQRTLSRRLGQLGPQDPPEAVAGSSDADTSHVASIGIAAAATPAPPVKAIQVSGRARAVRNWTAEEKAPVIARVRAGEPAAVGLWLAR